jgi:hypothetical protein
MAGTGKMKIEIELDDAEIIADVLKQIHAQTVNICIGKLDKYALREKAKKLMDATVDQYIAEQMTSIEEVRATVRSELERNIRRKLNKLLYDEKETK